MTLQSESERQRIKFGGRSDFASYREGRRQRKRAGTATTTAIFTVSLIFVNIMARPFGRFLVVHSTKIRHVLSVPTLKATRQQKCQTISHRTSGFCPVSRSNFDGTAFSTSNERRIVPKPSTILQEKKCPRVNLQPNHSHSHPFEAKRFSSWSVYGATKENSAEIVAEKKEDKEELKPSENTNNDGKTIHDKWNVKELLKETERLTIRCTKKIGKANTRYENSMEVVSQLLAEGANPSVEELDRCPDVASIEQELNELRQRLKNLHQLEAMLIEFSTKVGKKKLQSVVLPEDVASLAIQLEVKDSPPKRLSPAQKKRPRNPNNNNNGPRKPYRTYLSKHDVEIRVGKQAGDNDELSINPEHRDGADWWMHASGCPGSHVVIRSHDEPLDQEIVKDAAALAARQSKCNGQTIKVSMVRCRDVSKPPGAKPGLVQLRGNIRTITVNMKEAEKRLLRLDETVII